MGLLNTTIFSGLIIANYINNSPLKIFPHQTFFPSLTFSDFRLSRFTNTALYFQIQSNLRIKKSHFKMFLKTPIIESRPPIENFERKCSDRIKHLAKITESTFQICSTDREADTDAVNSSGGALFFDDLIDTISILQCNFAYCHAGINGGAIFISYATIVNIHFSFFQDCTTGFLVDRENVTEAKGGAIFANCVSCYIVGCNFTRCSIDYEIPRYGGAIYFARCLKVSPQRLEVMLSNFERCGYISARLGVDHGGALYINCTNTEGNEYTVNISYTNFSNCLYGESGSIIEVVGEASTVYFRHTGFRRDTNLHILDQTNYALVNISNSNSSSPSKLSLYNISINETLEDSSQPDESHHVNFSFYSCNSDIAHNADNLGSIYLSNDYEQCVFLNNKPINMLDYVNLYPISKYSYPFITALDDDTKYKPFATPTQSQSPSRSPLETPTQVVTPSSSLSSSDPNNSPQPEQTSTPTTDNGSNSDSSGGTTKSGGLSTAAIVLIVIACIIVLITIILISVLCVRNGHCGNSNYQIHDTRSAQNDESIRRFSYF